MMNKDQESYTLKDFFNTISQYFAILTKKYKLILAISIIGGILGFTYASLQKIKYEAVLTYSVDDESQGGMSAYAGIASQFGIDLGGGSSGLFTNDNLMEFLRSRKMISSVLLTPIEVNSKKQLLIDFYADVYGYKKKWAKNPLVSNLDFEKPKPSQIIFRDSVISAIHKSILANQLIISKVDKKLSITSVKFSSLNPILSKIFVELLVKNASDYYITTKTKKSRKNVMELQKKADSLKVEISKAMYGRANSSDQNLMIVRQRAAIGRVKAEMDLQMLSAIYSEVVKNLEMAKFGLMNDEPVIEIIDRPVLPLKIYKTSRVITAVLFSFLFGLFTVLFILSKSVFFRTNDYEK